MPVLLFFFFFWLMFLSLSKLTGRSCLGPLVDKIGSVGSVCWCRDTTIQAMLRANMPHTCVSRVGSSPPAVFTCLLSLRLKVCPRRCTSALTVCSIGVRTIVCLSEDKNTGKGHMTQTHAVRRLSELSLPPVQNCCTALWDNVASVYFLVHAF